MQKKIIVTGGSGFIGSSLIKDLQKDYEVYNIDKNAVSNTNSIKLDLCAKEKTIIQFTEIKPDVVYHLAASTDVRTEDTCLDFQNNVSATINVLEACRLNKVEKFIFTSSAAVYGDNANFPLDESESLSPVSSYGLSKKVAEEYINYYHMKYRLPVSIIRLSNVFGINTQNILKSKGVIANFLVSLYTEKEIAVYGDGRQTRDYIYIHDVVTVLNSLIEGPIGTFNMSSNTETSLIELIATLKKLTMIDFDYKYLPKKDSEILRSVLSNYKLKSALNWLPKYSLDNGILEMIDIIKRSRLNHAAK